MACFFQALFEFTERKIHYLFPAEVNIATRGMAAAHSSPHLKKIILSEESYVWPYINGDIKGLALTPIYKTLANGLDRTPDEKFYAIISALDLIRLGGCVKIKLQKKYWKIIYGISKNQAKQ